MGYSVRRLLMDKRKLLKELRDDLLVYLIALLALLVVIAWVLFQRPYAEQYQRSAARWSAVAEQAVDLAVDETLHKRPNPWLKKKTSQIEREIEWATKE
jgi:hypothetical protein